MFTNRRVKVRDLLGIANHSLRKHGKHTIKSYTTVLNRARPRNKRSIQGKKHIGLSKTTSFIKVPGQNVQLIVVFSFISGKGLFCCRKPPKTEESSSINTHYQRAHKKNVLKSFYSKESKDTNTAYSFSRSIDDKAYLRPGIEISVLD